MEKSKLLDELVKMTKNHKDEAHQFLALSDKGLNYKLDSETWSILECFEHLNRYGRFYIPEINQRIEANTKPNSDIFNTGILGDYFAKSMLPGEKMKKIKTFKSMNPNQSNLDRSTIDEFIEQQDALLTILEKAKKLNLTKIRTSISISSWIKLRLGDTLRVVIYHNWRHLEQARENMNQLQVTN